MPQSSYQVQSMYKPNNSSIAPGEESMPLSYDLAQNVSNPNMDSSTPAQAILPLSPVLMQNVAGRNNDSRAYDEENYKQLEASMKPFVQLLVLHTMQMGFVSASYMGSM
jgi:hypothetical protein